MKFEEGSDRTGQRKPEQETEIERESAISMLVVYPVFFTDCSLSHLPTPAPPPMAGICPHRVSWIQPRWRFMRWTSTSSNGLCGSMGPMEHLPGRARFGSYLSYLSWFTLKWRYPKTIGFNLDDLGYPSSALNLVLQTCRRPKAAKCTMYCTMYFYLGFGPLFHDVFGLGDRLCSA